MKYSSQSLLSNDQMHTIQDSIKIPTLQVKNIENEQTRKYSNTGHHPLSSASNQVIEEFTAKYKLVKAIRAKLNNIKATEKRNKFKDPVSTQHENSIIAKFQAKSRATNLYSKEVVGNVHQENRVISDDILPLLVANERSNVIERDSIAPEQPKNTYPIVIGQYTSDIFTSKEHSSFTTTSSAIGTFVSLNQNQSFIPINMQLLNEMIDVSNDNMNEKIHYLKGLQNVVSKKQKTDVPLASNGLHTDRFNANNEFNKVDISEGSSPDVSAACHHSDVSCDDELQVKHKRIDHIDQIVAENEYHTCHRDCALFLAQIGESFMNHISKNDFNMTRESKKVFEELVELQSKGGDAVMYLPGIVGSLCKRIVDLEEP